MLIGPNTCCTYCCRGDAFLEPYMQGLGHSLNSPAPKCQQDDVPPPLPHYNGNHQALADNLTAQFSIVDTTTTIDQVTDMSSNGHMTQ